MAGVLSGNRNFEGRIHPQVRANYLASPMLVVVYGLAGRIDIDLKNEPIGKISENSISPLYFEKWRNYRKNPFILSGELYQVHSYPRAALKIFLGHYLGSKLNIDSDRGFSVEF